MAKQIFLGRYPSKIYAFFEEWDAGPHLFFVAFGITRLHCTLPKFLDRLIFWAG